ncbi:bifunctional DNA primase/polymerase [Aureimonas altamirensis]|uniref:bifunctional DNA primase/polymerase n=1 Tax=Aureimonas altamirensis TaxID=370622 RepID=UPI001E586BA4|nr:bifunctional DNA primase/polymerase [Aureimonas altamirensis]UHD44028.1 bifunctional DNA primase/polymerase [Aureimonas altamirensis]
MAPLPKIQPIRAVDIARRYIGAGVKVFPCRPAPEKSVNQSTGEVVEWSEKSPYTSRGLKDATLSARIVEIWFGERHPAALIGVPTGSALGAWVLDIDRHGEIDGHNWLAEMESAFGPLPDTARAVTANGGSHYFFQHVEGVRNRASIAPGVDTRGDGGYVIAPGSVMRDGRSYEWVVDFDGGMPQFAKAPDWLLELVVAKQTSVADAPQYRGVVSGSFSDQYVEKAVRSELSETAGVAMGAGRNSRLNEASFALGTFVGAGALGEQEARHMLQDVARSWGRDLQRSFKTIENGLKAGIMRPRPTPEPVSASNDNTRPVSTAHLVENARKKLDGTEKGNGQPDGEKRSRFDLTWFDDIEDTVAIQACRHSPLEGIPAHSDRWRHILPPSVGVPVHDGSNARRLR